MVKEEKEICKEIEQLMIEELQSKDVEQELKIQVRVPEENRDSNKDDPTP
jgi:predicted transcriptional regulator